MSRPEDLYEGQRWLDTAEDDLRAAMILRDGGLQAHACFSAEQCAEKAVKGVWYAGGEEPWGHSIQKLILEGRVWQGRPGQERWRERAAALDRFYIPTRYPNGLPDLTPGQTYFDKDAEEAIDNARWVLEQCRGLLAEIRQMLETGNSAMEDQAE